MNQITKCIHVADDANKEHVAILHDAIFSNMLSQRIRHINVYRDCDQQIYILRTVTSRREVLLKLHSTYSLSYSYFEHNYRTRQFYDHSTSNYTSVQRTIKATRYPKQSSIK